MPSDEVLVDLANHPGWQILEERAAAHWEREANDLARTILRSPGDLDPVKIARARGFWAGQRWLLRQVRHELRVFQRENERSSTT